MDNDLVSFLLPQPPAAMTDPQSNSAPTTRIKWWLADMPPLDGRLRFVFYAAMLWLSWINFKSPLAGTGFYAQTDPRMFRPYGLLEWLGVGYLPVATIENIVLVVTVAWVATAIGLRGRITALFCGIGVLFLQGMFLGSNSLNHYYFLPAYTMLALSAACPSADRWSVDYWIHRWRDPSWKPSPEARTGLARNLVLIFTVGFYFAAGICKLVNTGLGWADGESILYFCELRKPYPLTEVMANYPLLALFGACGALVFETGAPVMLFSRTLRHVWIVGLIGMHVVIRYSMGPAYWPNVLCLLLLVDWVWVLQLTSWLAKKCIGVELPQLISRSPAASIGAVGRTLEATLLAVVLSTGIFGIFCWPLTNVYMYCGYFSIEKDIRAGHPRLAFYQPESIQQIARKYDRTKPPIEVAEYLSFQVALRLASDDGPPKYLYESLGVSTWKQLVLTKLQPVLIDDLTYKPTGRLEFDAYDSDYPAQQFLLDYVEVLKDHQPPELLAQYDRVELVLPFADEAGEETALLPAEVLKEYAEHDVILPPKIKMTPIASVDVD